MVTVQKIFTNLLFSETLKGISITKSLANLTFVQLSVDEIVGGPHNPPWYKVWVRNSLVLEGLKLLPS